MARTELEHVRNRLDRMQDELDKALAMANAQTELIRIVIEDFMDQLNANHQIVMKQLLAIAQVSGAKKVRRKGGDEG